MKAWVYNPQKGGNKIPLQRYEEICKQAESFAQKRAWYPNIRLKLRFKSQFCYVDTIETGNDRSFPLCRLRNISKGWSLALFSYSNDSYQQCVFSNGKWEGTLEEALELCEAFIV